MGKNLIEWTAECQQAFQWLKQLCSQSPILAYANYRRPFKLHTDTSEKGLGTVLYQKQHDGTDQVTAYASHILLKLGKNYHAHKLEFLALKWSVTERFHEYLHGGHFEVYTDNNPLTYILTTTRLYVTGQQWVDSLANYDFKIFYKSGKLNVDADALSHIPWENAQVHHMEPLVVKAILKSKLVMNVEIPNVYPQVNVLLKSLVVDSSPKLTNKDWIREQSEDSSIGPFIQLLKCDKLKNYVALELDSSAMYVFMKYQKDLFWKDGILYQKVLLKNHQEPTLQFVLPHNFVHKVILACHDDNGHLGMERTLGLLQERIFWPKMVEDMHVHICMCDQ